MAAAGPRTAACLSTMGVLKDEGEEGGSALSHAEKEWIWSGGKAGQVILGATRRRDMGSVSCIVVPGTCVKSQEIS